MTCDRPKDTTSRFVVYFCNTKLAVAFSTRYNCFVKYFGMLANKILPKSILGRTKDFLEVSFWCCNVQCIWSAVMFVRYDETFASLYWHARSRLNFREKWYQRLFNYPLFLRFYRKWLSHILMDFEVYGFCSSEVLRKSWFSFSLN